MIAVYDIKFDKIHEWHIPNTTNFLVYPTLLLAQYLSYKLYNFCNRRQEFFWL